MKRTVGLVIFSLLLIAMAANVTAPSEAVEKDFFINPATGHPNVTILVGSNAAAKDVVSASIVAAKVASLAYYQMEVVKPGEIKIAEHLNIGLYDWDNDSFVFDEAKGYPTVDVPDAAQYTLDYNIPPICYTLPTLWYFDDYENLMWGDGDNTSDPWETHEEIQLRFDNLPHIDTMLGSPVPDWIADAWGGDANIGNNRIPSIIYRADNIFVPPMIECVEEFNAPWGRDVIDLDREAQRTYEIPDPYLVYLEALPRFKLFHRVYTVIDAGPIQDINLRSYEIGLQHGKPYLVTADAFIEYESYLKINEPNTYGPWTITLLDADVDHNKAWLQVESPDGETEEFMMVLDPEHGFSPNLQQQGQKGRPYYWFYDQSEMPVYFNKWIVGRAEHDVYGRLQYEGYYDNKGDYWFLFSVPELVLDGVKVFIGAAGTVAMESKVYWIENKKIWKNRMCCDPFVVEANNYQLFLDAYQCGWDNFRDWIPNKHTWKGGWIPGTGFWPGFAPVSGNPNYPVNDPLLDANDGHAIMIKSPDTLPEWTDLDNDGTIFNDQPDEDWWDIEDPAWVGFNPLQTLVELNVAICDTIYMPLCNTKWVIMGPFPVDPPYFTIEVTDVTWDDNQSGVPYGYGVTMDMLGNRFPVACDNTDDGLRYSTLMESGSISYMETFPATVEVTKLVKLDIEYDFEGWKAGAFNVNLILIGGPVANIVVTQLVNEGISVVDWVISAGEWELLRSPYGKDDILIVAGQDRDATYMAVENLVATIN